MPRGRKSALTTSIEQAKAQGMKASAKEMKKQLEMEQSIADTLKKHREEMDKLAAEYEAENQLEAPEQTETEQPEISNASEAQNEAEAADGNAEEEPLKDPTEGQDLTHNYDLSLYEFCDKTLSLLSAASQAVRTMRIKFGNYETKIAQLKERLRSQTELENAVGFHYISVGKWHTPRTKKCPRCGRMPSVQKMKDGSGYAVICDECWTRAETADGPMAAIKNWNDGKETELSQMLNQPLITK